MVMIEDLKQQLTTATTNAAKARTDAALATAERLRAEREFEADVSSDARWSKVEKARSLEARATATATALEKSRDAAVKALHAA